MKCVKMLSLWNKWVRQKWSALNREKMVLIWHLRHWYRLISSCPARLDCLIWIIFFPSVFWVIATPMFLTAPNRLESCVHTADILNEECGRKMRVRVCLNRPKPLSLMLSDCDGWAFVLVQIIVHFTSPFMSISPGPFLSLSIHLRVCVWVRLC